MNGEPLRLGTRGSELAMRQAGEIRDAIEGRRQDVELVTVSTTGDRLDDELVRRLGKTGAFVREIDERVIAGELDGAVHSLKDMPTDMPSELIVAAIPERARTSDALLTPEGRDLEALPEGVTVGTGSLRRRAQLKRRRPDLVVEPIRGNVDTRIAKLLAPTLQARRHALAADDEARLEEWLEDRSPLERRALDRDVATKYDALVLAMAGLERADLTGAAGLVQLSPDAFVPAPGQGALALVMRDAEPAERIHRQLDHPPSRVAVTVERIVLSTLGGGCIAPIGVHAVVQGEVVRTRAQVLSAEGSHVVAATRELPIESYTDAAVAFAEDLAGEGATELIAGAKRDLREGPEPP